MFYRKDGDIIFENDENFENKKKPLKNTENEDTKSCDCMVWYWVVGILVVLLLVSLYFNLDKIKSLIPKKTETTNMVSEIVEEVVKSTE